MVFISFAFSQFSKKLSNLTVSPDLMSMLSHCSTSYLLIKTFYIMLLVITITLKTMITDIVVYIIPYAYIIIIYINKHT